MRNGKSTELWQMRLVGLDDARRYAAMRIWNEYGMSSSTHIKQPLAPLVTLPFLSFFSALSVLFVSFFFFLYIILALSACLCPLPPLTFHSISPPTGLLPSGTLPASESQYCKVTLQISLQTTILLNLPACCFSHQRFCTWFAPSQSEAITFVHWLFPHYTTFCKPYHQPIISPQYLM